MSVTSTPRATSRHAAALAAGLRVADPDRRFYAFAVDRAIAWGIDVAVALLVHHYVIARGHMLRGVLFIVGTVIVVGWAMSLLLGMTGRTPGKALLALRAVDPPSGEPVGLDRAMLRTATLGLATLPFGFGLAALAWTALTDPSGLRRGWHDKLATTVVVDDRPLPVVEDVEEPRPRAVVNLTAMRLMPTPDLAGAESQQVPARAPARTRPAHAAESVPAPPPPAWGLTFDTGERVVVDAPVLVGRQPEPQPGERRARLVTLASDDLSVSQTHLQVVAAPDGALVVTDRGSTNGSVLVRRGVRRPLGPGRPTTLLEGDVVVLGDRTMTVVRLERPAD